MRPLRHDDGAGGDRAGEVGAVRALDAVRRPHDLVHVHDLPSGSAVGGERRSRGREGGGGGRRGGPARLLSRSVSATSKSLNVYGATPLLRAKDTWS